MRYLGRDDSKVVNLISQKLFIGSRKRLFDSFQGCFKDNLRFFAGLYFLYRWTILLIDMNTINYGSYYTAVTIALLAILILHVLCQPYIMSVHNVIDTLACCLLNQRYLLS